MKAELDKYNNSWYNPGKNRLICFLWYFTNSLFFINSLIPASSLKVVLLRLFGAKIGKGVVIKPRVNIKYPWNLEVGDHVWIGESVWIDNLAKVSIDSNVCISQGAMLLCGNHNYKKATFDLMVNSIVIEEGAWVGAKCVVCPGVVMRSHSILTVGSIASKELEVYGIYRGNPAMKVAERVIEE